MIFFVHHRVSTLYALDSASGWMLRVSPTTQFKYSPATSSYPIELRARPILLLLDSFLIFVFLSFHFLRQRFNYSSNAP